MPPDWWDRLTCDISYPHPLPDRVIGMDEVGTGAVAGPYVVCAVHAPFDWTMDGLRDSKQLSAGQRDVMDARLRADTTITFSLWSTTSYLVDWMTPENALTYTYVNAYAPFKYNGAQLIIDGRPHIAGALATPKGDTFIPTVMAASILAKVYRDGIMVELSSKYPAYDLAQNKGYGTPKHLEAINKHGITPIHRKTYLSGKKVRHR